MNGVKFPEIYTDEWAKEGVEQVMSGIDLQGVLFGPQRSGMFGCGGTSTEQVRVADDTWEEKSAEVKVVVIPNDAAGIDVKVVVIPEDANTYYLPEITSVEVEDLMAVTDFAAGEAETIAQEEGVAFCNLPKDLTTNIAVLPICIRRPETDEFKYKSLDSNAPAAITVNGIPIALYPACFDPFWGDAYLNLGENSIVGSLAYQGGESYQVEIKVYFDPAFSTANRALLYGIRQKQIAVIDVEKGWMLGEMQSGLMGLGAKNLQISPDGHYLYSPREAGLEVIDTASHSVVKTISMDTGGYAALTPGGDRMFLNRHTKDGIESYYRTNLVDTVTWEQLLSFNGGGPDYPMAVVPFTENKVYMNYSYSVYVYFPPDYTVSKYLSGGSGPAFAVSPMGNWAAVGSYTVYMLDAKLDQEIYSFKPTIGSVSDAVFSPDGELVYLVGESGIEAHYMAAKATLWITAPYTVKGKKVALTPDGKFIYGIEPNVCGADLSILDASNGAVVGMAPKVTTTGAMVYKTPW